MIKTQSKVHCSVHLSRWLYKKDRYWSQHTSYTFTNILKQILIIKLIIEENTNRSAFFSSKFDNANCSFPILDILSVTLLTLDISFYVVETYM